MRIRSLSQERPAASRTVIVMWPVLDLQLTVADLVAFQRYCFANHPTGRKAVAKQRAMLIVAGVVGASIGVQIFGGVFWTLGGGLPMILFLGVYATIMWFAAPRILVEAYERRLNRQVPTRSFPPFRLWLDEWGISNNSDLRYTRYPWAVVQGVVETSTHVFVWTSREVALVIPRRTGEPYVRAFISGIMAYVPQAPYERAYEFGLSGT